MVVVVRRSSCTSICNPCRRKLTTIKYASEISRGGPHKISSFSQICALQLEFEFFRCAFTLPFTAPLLGASTLTISPVHMRQYVCCWICLGAIAKLWQWKNKQVSLEPKRLHIRNTVLYIGPSYLIWRRAPDTFGGEPPILIPNTYGGEPPTGDGSGAPYTGCTHMIT